MSALVGGALPNPLLFSPHAIPHGTQDYAWIDPGNEFHTLPFWVNEDHVGFRTDFWPRVALALNAGGVADVLGSFAGDRVSWVASGANGRLGFVGYSRDQYGGPLPGATVRLFRTSTSELLAQVTSDVNTGFYVVTTPYSGAHFITCHISTPIASGGATADNLAPG